MGNDLRASRLHIAAFVEGAALQHGGAAIPAPRHAERVKAFGTMGSCSAAWAQLWPPSAETMTLVIRPVPE